MHSPQVPDHAPRPSHLSLFKIRLSHLIHLFLDLAPFFLPGRVFYPIYSWENTHLPPKLPDYISPLRRWIKCFLDPTTGHVVHPPKKVRLEFLQSLSDLVELWGLLYGQSVCGQDVDGVDWDEALEEVEKGLMVLCGEEVDWDEAVEGLGKGVETLVVESSSLQLVAQPVPMGL